MKYRIESDSIGEMKVNAAVYYGVQTQRAIENFDISRIKVSDYPELVRALGMVKLAAARANYDLGLLPKDIFKAIEAACKRVIAGEFNDQFPVDMIQGGAGTSTNMNANEVIANIALESLGKEKGDYKTISPNDHVNCSQSTNDSYPTALKIAFINSNKELVKHLQGLIDAFHRKGAEFASILKMGRTEMQDAVPMTLGQEFEAFAANLTEEVERLNQMARFFQEINMGATAIGTGINAAPGYAELVTSKLSAIVGMDFIKATNLIEATPDTGSYVIYSSALKRLAVKLSKISNDLRLLSSGPRCGFNEINLPALQPGSSIMPGKVNPVVPEMVNEVCYKVIGNDLTVTMASEAGQLQLNAMEPVIAEAILESITYLQRAMDTLVDKCVDGITANEDVCHNLVMNSIGLVTALNPYIGYKNSAMIAKEALKTGKGVYELVLEHNILPKEKLDEILDPENMIAPHPYVNKA
ncbi:MAG TPA: aspartate ammonia-lyase [Candidatus Merdimorpha stercoravium]|uniref:Aspartate ammonia-lyase n=1 Tax=Candidatus Merdimorpha stercoravium TaxID=2840863 RepID=A0A9D1HCQ4_9FLAO|nr:aspartate ammonia-lyase [Candidatus Merdimorpha stercoravium]